MDREAIEESSQKAQWIENVIVAVEKRSLRARQIGWVSRGIKEMSRLLKISFSRREKHRYEYNQA